MKLYADGGVWNGERILAEDYVQRAISFQISTCWQQNILGSDMPNQALASAYWDGDDTLVFIIKWIETCNTLTYCMTFSGNDLIIKYIPADSFIAKEITTSCKRI